MHKAQSEQEFRLDRARAALQGRLKRTQISLLAERLARCFWPVATLVLVALAVHLSGLSAGLPAPAVVSGFLLTLVASAYALFLGSRHFEWPTLDDATNRIDSVLPGSPLSALADSQAIGKKDPDAVAVWTRHLERMAELAATAKTAQPDLRLSSRDPWATRLVALVAIIAAVLFARNPDSIDLTELLAPEPARTIAAGPSFEAWAAPPAYTGKPTLYFNETSTDELDLPTGTEITVRVYGRAEDFALNETVSGEESALESAAEGIGSATFSVSQSGIFAVDSGNSTLGSWTISLIPDSPPTIELTEDVTRAVTGAMELTYAARDDYGVVAADATITLDMEDLDRRHGLAATPEQRDDIELDLPLPISGRAAEIEETLLEDLTKHPWAGLPIKLTLRATDAAEQTGMTEGVTAILPGRRFFDPLAQAIIEQRRDLLWSLDNAARVDQMLRVITHAPEDVFSNKTAFLMTRMALRRMAYVSEDGFTAEERDDIAELLWNVALLIEDGSLSDAREKLRRAQERLQEALRNGATDEEIAQLMEELREAMNDYMQQLAQEALERGEQMQSQGQQQPDMTITQDQLQALMDRIQELAEQGRTEEAEALLQELQQMMENLQMQLAEGAQGQQGSEGQQMMQELQDTLRQQQGLADDSFQQLQREFQQGQQGQQGQGQQGQQQPGQGQQGQQFGQGQQGQQGQQFGQGQQSPGRGQPGGRDGQSAQGQGGLTADELARRQEALRGMLEDLRGRLPGPSTEEGQAARRSLEEAERNMGEARDNLDAGDLPGAIDRQADAIDALRDGLRGLGDELQQQAQQNQGQSGAQAGDGFALDDQDPLGRPSGSRGTLRTDESMLPGIDPLRRAQELFDEIRRRSSDRERPEQELDYLRRLLDRF